MKWLIWDIQYLFYIHSGKDPDKPCIFPFKFLEETISSCTTIVLKKVCCYGTSRKWFYQDIKYRSSLYLFVFSPGALQRWILMGNWSELNGVTVVLTAQLRMISGLLMILWQWPPLMKTTEFNTSFYIYIYVYSSHLHVGSYYVILAFSRHSCLFFSFLICKLINFACFSYTPDPI